MPVVQQSKEARRIRFGSFQLDLQSLELSKSGLKLKIQGQPLKVLAFLLERPGQLVTREEIRQHLWPADTFVDFEHSLNTDIKRLREVLGDEAETPRYIETLRGRGYRFIGQVEQENAIRGNPALDAVVSTPAETQDERGRQLRLWKRSIAGLGLLIVGLVPAVYIFRPPAPLRIAASRRLTRTPYKKAVRMPSSIVTDGARIYFREYKNGRWEISEVSTAGGEVSTLPSGYAELTYIHDISPDFSELLIADLRLGEGWRFWLAPLPAGPARRVPILGSVWGLFAPDGHGLLYSAHQDKDLYRADKDGSNPRRLLSVPDITCPRVSPDGMRLRFTVVPDSRVIPAIWEVGMDGSNPHPLFADQQAPTLCGVWSPDGKLYAFHRWDGSRWNLWAVRESGNRRRLGRQEPVQLTFGPLSYQTSTFSRDSKTLYSLGVDARGELAAYTPNSSKSAPFLQGISASYVAFSRDGKWVAYVSYPEGTLWRSRIDGSERRQLTFPPIMAMLPVWSPDAKLIAFAEMGDIWSNIYLVPADGGNPMLLLAGAFMPNSPTWSPDGTVFAYGGCLKGCREQSELRIFDLKTQRSLTIPGSQDFYSPRWSPDGKYLVALGGDARTLWLYRFANKEWVKLASASYTFSWPEWSPDSRYVYVSGENENIIRINILNRHAEMALRTQDIPRTGWWGSVFGVTPDEQILLLRSTGSEDLYAFDLEGRE